MTALDDKFVPIALRLVTKFGISVSLQKQGKSYDPATRGLTGSNSSAQTITVTPPLKYAQEYVDNDHVRADDFYVYQAASGLVAANTPERNDVVVYNSENFKVVGIEPLVSGEQTAAYKIQLRKGAEEGLLA